MGSVETFVQAPVGEVRGACQVAGAAQRCIYNAQGELVCDAKRVDVFNGQDVLKNGAPLWVPGAKK